MKKGEILGAAAAIIGTASSAAYLIYFYQQSKPGTTTYSVAVTVLDPSRKTLPGVMVSIGTLSTITGIDGVAKFSGVLGGQQLLSVDAAGYQVVSETVNVYPTLAFEVDLTSQQACPPQQCALGQVWDQTFCRCSSLIPSFIDVPNSLTVSLQWLANFREIPYAQCASAYPGNPGQCGATYPGYPSFGCGPNDSYAVTVKGSVQDDRGNPIAGITVGVSLPTTVFHWQAPDGCASGDFVVSAPPSVTTDDSGNFQFDLGVRIANVQANQGCFFNLFGGTSPFAEIFTINYVIPGTQIRATTILTAQMLVCDYYGLFGI